jgi:flagellar hook-length control protein FliK
MKTAPAAVPQDASKLVKTEVLTAKQSNIQPISNPVQAAQNPTPALAHPERKISTDGDGKSEAPPSEVSKTQALPDDGGNLPELAPNEADVPEVSEPVNPRRTILNPGSDRGVAHLESASLASPPAAQAVTHAREVTPTPARPMAPAVHQVEKSAILDQLAKGIQVHQTPSNSEIRIRLVPDTLGEIHIKISLKADVLVAEIRATSGAAHEVLSKHTLEIQNVLQNAGLQTEQVLVKMAAPPMQGGWTGDATQRDSSSPGQPSRNNSSPRDQGSGDQQQPSRNPSRRNPWDGWDEYA